MFSRFAKDLKSIVKEILSGYPNLLSKTVTCITISDALIVNTLQALQEENYLSKSVTIIICILDIINSIIVDTFSCLFDYGNKNSSKMIGFIKPLRDIYIVLYTNPEIIYTWKNEGRKSVTPISNNK